VLLDLVVLFNLLNISVHVKCETVVILNGSELFISKLDLAI